MRETRPGATLDPMRTAKTSSSALRLIAPAVIVLFSGARAAFGAEPAIPAFAVDGYWNKVYSIPLSNGSYAVVVATTDLTGAEAGLIAMLAKAGGRKQPSNGPNGWWRMGITPSPSMDPSRCSYLGEWTVPTGKAVGVLKRVFDFGVIESYVRAPAGLSYDAKEVDDKRRNLKAERAALSSRAESIPAIMGLLEAELTALEAYASRYEAYRNESRIGLCIKPQ